MKIEQSTVAMSATHHFFSEHEFRHDAEYNFRRVFDDVSETVTTRSDKAEQERRMLLMLESLIDKILELVSGKGKVHVNDLREVMQTDDMALPDKASVQRGALSFDWTTKSTETIREHEATEFSTQGKVRTADGRLLDFSLELNLCRDFECTREVVSKGVVELRDPLVINFGGKGCELSGKRFAFDLDVDGQQESIPALARNSGFLAIDRNQDGCVTDGSELFGTRSGNGFVDLAVLDKDRNGWIDEADAVFDSLRVWRHDGNGIDTLNTLREEGIGALYLGSTSSEFQLTDDECHLLAQIRASGVYLKENGGAGSMQQVDLAV